MIMRTAHQYIKDTRGLEMPTGCINGEWFIKNDLPMITHCICCESVILLPNAMIDNDGYTYCFSCAKLEPDIII